MDAVIFERELIQAHAEDLRAIAFRTGSIVTFEELRSEAWIVACDIAVARGYAIDLLNAAERDLVLRDLQGRLKAVCRGRPRTVSADQTWTRNDGTESGMTLLSLLTGPEDSDPLVSFARVDEEINWADLARSSYSELCAYLILFIRFGWERVEVAAHLAVSVLTLRVRLTVAANRMRVQPSLFDGIEAVDPHFVALSARSRATRGIWAQEPEQQAWCF